MCDLPSRSKKFFIWLQSLRAHLNIKMRAWGIWRGQSCWWLNYWWANDNHFLWFSIIFSVLSLLLASNMLPKIIKSSSTYFHETNQDLIMWPIVFKLPGQKNFTYWVLRMKSSLLWSAQTKIYKLYFLTSRQDETFFFILWNFGKFMNLPLQAWESSMRVEGMQMVKESRTQHGLWKIWLLL